MAYLGLYEEIWNDIDYGDYAYFFTLSALVVQLEYEKAQKGAHGWLFKEPPFKAMRKIMNVHERR